MGSEEKCCLSVFSCFNNKLRNGVNSKSRRRGSASHTLSTNLCGGGACKLPERRYPPRTYSRSVLSSSSPAAATAAAGQIDRRGGLALLIGNSAGDQSLKQFEEIELKCYSLSPDCLLVNSDKRCQLIDMTHGMTRTRLLCDFEDSRKHLDTRRPDSVSLIKFRIDPASGEIERRLSIRDIDQDNDFDNDVSPPGTADTCTTQQVDCASGVTAAATAAADSIGTKRERNKLKLSERLSRRSFVLIERAKPTSDDCATNANDIQSRAIVDANSPPQSYQDDCCALLDRHHTTPSEVENIQAAVAAGAKHVAQPASQLISESWKKIESWPPSDDTRAETSNLENELISSISIEVPQQQLQQQQQQQELQEHISIEPSPVKKKRKRSLARRLYRLIKGGGGGGGGGSSKVNSLGHANYSTLGSTSSSDYSNNCTVSGVSYEQRYFASDDYCDQSYQNNSCQVAPISNPSQTRAQIVARYPVAEQANQLISLTRPESIYLWPNNSQQQIVPITPCSPPALSTSTNPFYPQQQQQCSSPIAMISYNHAEAKDYAIALHAQLEQLGVSTYLDLYHIGKGHDWQDSLNGAILNCSLFIPLVTPSYGETLWTSRECKLADVLAKRIIPINFGQKWPPPSLAIQLATLQYIDWLHTDLCQSPPTPPSPAAAPPPSPPLVQTSETVNCQNELKQQQQQLLSQSTSCSRQLQKSMSWPSQYVETVAQQLKLSIQTELNSAASQNAVATGQAHHKATTATTNRAIEQPPPAPPSPQSDSGFYEEMPAQLARPPEPVPTGAAANQMSAKVATVAPTRKTGVTVRPETIESSRAPGAGRFSQRGPSKLRVCTRASLKDCSDTEPIMTACPKGASPPVLSYGALELVDAFGSGELSPTYSQSSSSDEPNLVVMPGLESNGFRLKSTRVSNNKDKDKTRAPPATTTTNCNGSSRGTRESHDCDRDYDNTYEIIGCQEDNSIESSEREQVIKKHSHGHVSIKRMARKKSIGHHAKKVLSWIKRPSVA